MEKKNEMQLRRSLAKIGLQLSKSRKQLSADNQGEYMIIDANTRAVITGHRYDLTLEDVNNWLNE